jgi:hypothetical protein
MKKSAASILKQQVSLYATTTGIKWDFNEEHVLAGQAVCFWLYCGCMDATVRHICEYILLTVAFCLCGFHFWQAVQPKGGIRRFCIDPNEYSNFEIANHL